MCAFVHIYKYLYEHLNASIVLTNVIGNPNRITKHNEKLFIYVYKQYSLRLVL